MQSILRKQFFFGFMISIMIIALLIGSPMHSGYQSSTTAEPKSNDIIQLPSRLLQSAPQDLVSQARFIPLSSSTSTSFADSTLIFPKDKFPIQSHPQLINHQETVFVLAETQTTLDSPGQLTATYSTDNGRTWMERMTISHNQTSFTHPTVDYTGDDAMQAYGSHLIDENTGAQLIFGFPNLTDPTGGYEGSTADFDMYGWFNGRILTWDSEYWTELGDTASAGYPHGTDIGPYENFHGLTIWAGHDGTGWSYYFFCETDETTDQPYKFLWKNYLDGPIINVDIDIDLSTGWEYDLCERINATTAKPEILMDMLFLEPGNPTWYNKEENYGPSYVFKDYKNPMLKASNGYVYLVCERDHEIFLHHSSDKGASFSTKQLTFTDDIESHPQVTATGNSVAVTFVKNQSLYMISSTNGGLDFSQPMQITSENIQVSDQIHAVHVDGDAISFKDVNASLFCDVVNLSSPIITIDEINGGFSVSATVKNSGNVDATNVPYSIRIDKGVLLSPRIYSGSITVPAGESRTIKTTGLFFGIGRPLVTVQVGSVSVSKDAFLILVYMNL